MLRILNDNIAAQGMELKCASQRLIWQGKLLQKLSFSDVYEKGLQSNMQGKLVHGAEGKDY